jgi:hypothetical protein
VRAHLTWTTMDTEAKTRFLSLGGSNAYFGCWYCYTSGVYVERCVYSSRLCFVGDFLDTFTFREAKLIFHAMDAVSRKMLSITNSQSRTRQRYFNSRRNCHLVHSIASLLLLLISCTWYVSHFPIRLISQV